MTSRVVISTRGFKGRNSHLNYNINILIPVLLTAGAQRGEEGESTAPADLGC